MISTASEWDCTPSTEAQAFADTVEADLTTFWVEEYAPWLAKLSWQELVEWVVTHIKFGGPKRGDR
jgi:hypothetical protein